MKGKQAKAFHHYNLFSFLFLSRGCPWKSQLREPGKPPTLHIQTEQWQEGFKKWKQILWIQHWKSNWLWDAENPPRWVGALFQHKAERGFPNSQCTWVSYQHLRSRRQTIDCWFLWEERKIINPSCALISSRTWQWHQPHSPSTYREISLLLFPWQLRDLSRSFCVLLDVFQHPIPIAWKGAQTWFAEKKNRK